MTNPDPAAPGISIRPETPADAVAIDEVVAAAFVLAEHSAPPVEPGGPPGEVDLVHRLREDDAWLPQLALVAVSDGQVVGHVVCTRAHVNDVPALGLGPLSVHPDQQRQGIGAALMREVLDIAERSGETLVALVGDPAYYSRFGFAPGSRLGVESPNPAYGDYFQAKALGTGSPPGGRFRFAGPFGD